MARLAKIILGAWLAVTLILAVPIVITLIRGSVSTDSFSRSAEPRILFGPGPSHVQVDFTPESTGCPVIPLSILLLIDKSGSMNDGNAFPLAREAAIAFINNVDLSQSTVAIAYFDDTAHLIQAATQDRDALITAVNQVTLPYDGTDLTRALQFAASNIGSDRPVVVLLTDGGANDPAGAMAAGDALKSAGAHLVTVAVGPLAEVDYLRSLASSPAAALASDDPADLQSIYTSLAGQLNNIVARDIMLTEPVSEGLTIVPESVAPLATQNGNDLVWQVGFIPATGVTFRYDVTTEGIGWPKIASETATMSFIDCQAGLASLSLGGGPRILILPGPAFWIPWLLALLVPVFLLFRGKKQVPPPVTVAAASSVPIASPDPTPAWLRRLDSTDKVLGISEVESESGTLVPTIIVGLGPVGRIVLSQVAQALNGRFARRDKLPVRLLQVDVQPTSGPISERPDYLLPDEWVILRPDYQLISRTLQTHPDEWEHMNWYEPTAAADYGRARGRMALFYDLRNGTANSTLYRGLMKAADNMVNPRLRVIGSTFDDVSSGMLVDVSWLMWLATKRHVDVELWLSGPLNQNWSPRLDNANHTVTVDEQRARTLATLREIERFQRNAIVPLHYVPHDMGQEEFYQEVDSAVVQTLFLFEAPQDKKIVVEDHLATLTDSLVALLNPSVQKEVTEHLVRFQADAFDLVNRDGHGLVCGIGTYAISTPLAPLHEALTWRLVHDLVCEARTGLLPARQLGLDGKYETKKPDDIISFTVRRTEIEDFIDNRRAHLHHDAFRQAVAAQVADMLNGEGGKIPAIDRSGGIRRARKWVDMLRTVLKQDGEEMAAAPLADLIRELDEWDNFLHKDLSTLATERLAAARERLGKLTSQGGRSWSIDAELEWPAYKAHIRSWLDRPSTALAGEAIVRVCQRFGWQVTYDPTAPGWQVELWIPDGEFIWAGQPIASGGLAVPQDSAKVLDRLYHLARPLAYSTESHGNVLKRAADMDSVTWLNAAEPRLRVNDLTISKLLKGANSVHPFLAARETDNTPKIRQGLSSTGDAQQVTACAIEDATTVTLLRVRDRLPMSATYLYGEDRDGNSAWNQTIVTPAHYVWRGEQAAAEHEIGERLGSRFVGYLERDEKLVDLYARAVLFGLFEETRDGVAIGGAQGWAWPGKTAGDALVNLFNVDSTQRPGVLNERGGAGRMEAFQAVEEAIERSVEHIRSSTGLAQFRREAERVLQKRQRSRIELESVEPWQRDYEDYFRPLAKDASSEDRDLRLYLLYILSTLQ